jgi:hypothetical protein
MAAKKKYRRAGRRARRTILPARLGVGKKGLNTGKNDLRRNEKGFFGLGMSFLFFIIMMVIAGVIVATLPSIVRAVISGMQPHVLAVHVPYMVGDDPMMVKADPAMTSAGMFGMNQAMGELYCQLRFVAMIVFVVVFVLIGITYLLEQFKLVGEGTAHRMTSESILFAILLFVFPLIFNLSATVLNSITEGTILTHTDTDPTGVTVTTDAPTMVNRAAGFAADLPKWGPGGIGYIISVFVFGTFALTAAFTFIVAGSLRLLGTVAFAAAFPLVLVLYIIPFTRRVGETCVSTLIGLMVSTVFIAIFFRVVWQAFPVGCEDTLTKWIMGVGVLSAGAMLPTAFAPAMGRTFSTAASGVASSAGAAMGGTIAASGGLASGGLGGVVGGAKGMAGMDLSKGQQAKVLGFSALTGGIKGMGTKSPFGGFMVGAGTSAEGARAMAEKMGGLPMSSKPFWENQFSGGQIKISGGGAFAQKMSGPSEAELKEAKDIVGPHIHDLMKGEGRGLKEWHNLSHRQQEKFDFMHRYLQDGKAPSKARVDADLRRDPEKGIVQAEDSYKEFGLSRSTYDDAAVDVALAPALKEYGKWYDNIRKR